jgi:hypothetical protein
MRRAAALLQVFYRARLRARRVLQLQLLWRSRAARRLLREKQLAAANADVHYNSNNSNSSSSSGDDSAASSMCKSDTAVFQAQEDPSGSLISSKDAEIERLQQELASLRAATAQNDKDACTMDSGEQMQGKDGVQEEQQAPEAFHRSPTHAFTETRLATTTTDVHEQPSSPLSSGALRLANMTAGELSAELLRERQVRVYLEDEIIRLRHISMDLNSQVGLTLYLPVYTSI